MPSFDPAQHTYNSPEFAKDLDKAVSFLLKTPAYKLPTRDAPSPDAPPSFPGPGVYALYYRGPREIYAPLARINVKKRTHPIYVGSALPAGWRKARASLGKAKTLYNRLRQHADSIASTTGERSLNVSDFWCQFVILNDPESKMITVIESQLIYLYRPLWNSYVDGFGNHVVGVKREGGLLPMWDTLHSGRPGRGTAAEDRLAKVLKIVEEALIELGSP